MQEIDAGLTPLERRRWSRSDRIGMHAAAEAFAMPACSTAARIGRGSACSSAPARRTCCATSSSIRPGSPRGSSRTRPSDVWNHFSSTPVDVIAGRFGLEGPRGCVVAACSSSTIAIGRAADAIRDGRADAVLAGGTDALARLTFSGFNLLRLMDPAPCRPFDRSRAGMNIGEGAGDPGARGSRSGAPPRRADLRRAGGLWSGVRGVSPDGARAGGPARGGGHRRGAARMPASTPTRCEHINAHGTATPQNDAAEARGVPTRVRRPRGARAGHVDEVDDRPLPRRRRRRRGGGARAHHRARRDPADDSSRRNRRGLRARHRRQPDARNSACAARCRRRSAFGGNDFGARDARGVRTANGEIRDWVNA